MICTKDGRADGRRRLYGFAKTNLVALALGATLCGASAGPDFVEVLTECQVQYLSHGDARFVDARRY